MRTDSHFARNALRRLPAPEPAPGFVDRAFARAVAAAEGPAPRTPAGWMRRLFGGPQFWIGAAAGAAAMLLLALVMVRPDVPVVGAPLQVALALHETRTIDVLIDSERDLDDASIRVLVSGSVVFDGLENERDIGWRTALVRGSNLLSLPVSARNAGAGRLVAVIQHEGRTRSVMIDLTVSTREAARS